MEITKLTKEHKNKNDNILYEAYLIPSHTKIVDDIVKNCVDNHSIFIGIERKCKGLIWASLPKSDMLSGYCLLEILIDRNQNSNSKGIKFMLDNYMKFYSYSSKFRLLMKHFIYHNDYETLTKKINGNALIEMLSRINNASPCDNSLYNKYIKNDFFINIINSKKTEYYYIKKGLVKFTKDFEKYIKEIHDKMCILLLCSDGNWRVHYTIGNDILHCPLSTINYKLKSRFEKKNYHLRNLNNFRLEMSSKNEIIGNYVNDTICDETYYKFIQSMMKINLNLNSNESFLLYFNRFKGLMKIKVDENQNIDYKLAILLTDYEKNAIGLKQLDGFMKDCLIKLNNNYLWETVDKSNQLSVNLKYDLSYIEYKLTSAYQRIKNKNSIIKISFSGKVYEIPSDNYKNLIFKDFNILNDDEIIILIITALDEQISVDIKNNYNFDSEFENYIKYLNGNNYALGIDSDWNFFKIPLKNGNLDLINESKNFNTNEDKKYGKMKLCEDISSYTLEIDEWGVLIKSKIIQKSNDPVVKYIKSKFHDTILNIENTNNVLYINSKEILTKCPLIDKNQIDLNKQTIVDIDDYFDWITSIKNAKLHVIKLINNNNEAILIKVSENGILNYNETQKIPIYIYYQMLRRFLHCEIEPESYMMLLYPKLNNCPYFRPTNMINKNVSNKNNNKDVIENFNIYPKEYADYFDFDESSHNFTNLKHLSHQNYVVQVENNLIKIPRNKNEGTFRFSEAIPVSEIEYHELNFLQQKPGLTYYIDSKDDLVEVENFNIKFDSISDMINYYKSRDIILFINEDGSVVKVPINDEYCDLTRLPLIPPNESEYLKVFGYIDKMKGFALAVDKDGNIIKQVIAVNLDDPKENIDLIENLSSKEALAYSVIVTEGTHKSFVGSIDKDEIDKYSIRQSVIVENSPEKRASQIVNFPYNQDSHKVHQRMSILSSEYIDKFYLLNGKSQNFIESCIMNDLAKDEKDIKIIIDNANEITSRLMDVDEDDDEDINGDEVLSLNHISRRKSSVKFRKLSFMSHHSIGNVLNFEDILEEYKNSSRNPSILSSKSKGTFKNIDDIDDNIDESKLSVRKSNISHLKLSNMKNENKLSGSIRSSFANIPINERETRSSILSKKPSIISLKRRSKKSSIYNLLSKDEVDPKYSYINYKYVKLKSNMGSLEMAKDYYVRLSKKRDLNNYKKCENNCENWVVYNTKGFKFDFNKNDLDKGDNNKIDLNEIDFHIDKNFRPTEIRPDTTNLNHDKAGDDPFNLNDNNLSANNSKEFTRLQFDFSRRGKNKYIKFNIYHSPRKSKLPPKKTDSVTVELNGDRSEHKDNTQISQNLDYKKSYSNEVEVIVEDDFQKNKYPKQNQILLDKIEGYKENDVKDDFQKDKYDKQNQILIDKIEGYKEYDIKDDFQKEKYAKQNQILIDKIESYRENVIPVIVKDDFQKEKNAKQNQILIDKIEGYKENVIPVDITNEYASISYDTIEINNSPILNAKRMEQMACENELNKKDKLYSLMISEEMFSENIEEVISGLDKLTNISPIYKEVYIENEPTKEKLLYSKNDVELSVSYDRFESMNTCEDGIETEMLTMNGCSSTTSSNEMNLHEQLVGSMRNKEMDIQYRLFNLDIDDNNDNNFFKSYSHNQMKHIINNIEVYPIDGWATRLENVLTNIILE